MQEEAAAATCSNLRLNGFDPDALAALITNARFEHRILRGGPFSASRQQVDWGDVILECGRYSLPVLAQGSFPGDSLCIGFTLDACEQGNLNGQLVLRGSPRIFTEGCEIAYRTAARLTWTSFHIAREELERASTTRLGRPLPIPARGLLNLLPSNAGRALARTIRETLSTASRASALPARFARVAREQLLHAYIDAIADSLQLDCRHLARTAIRRTAVVSRARDHMLANLDQPFSMQALCRATARTERVLQYVFREMYGVSPQAWFRVMKLNAIHRDLRSKGPGDVRITDVAMRWGFTHLGRFSGEYRRLFGERPIDTLRKRERKSIALASMA
jgi:AraC family transcriptional regulator, ethanolamine operon transcriptional activator